MTRRIITNTTLILLEQALRLLSGFVVGLWMARYLGPDRFGGLSFAIAWVALFSVLATLGLANVVSRDLVVSPQEAGTLLGTAAALKIVGSVFAVVLSSVLFGWLYGFDDKRLCIVLLVAVAVLFRAGEVVEYWFRSRVEWQFIFRARVGALAVATGCRVLLILLQRDVIWFAAVILLEAMVITLLLAREGVRHPAWVRQWRFSRSTAGMLLRSSFPLMLSGMAILVYMKMDQVMIGSMLSSSEVGIYSVAVRISGIWYIVPAAVTQTLMPSIVAAHARDDGTFEAELVRVVAILFWLSLLTTVIVTFVGPIVVPVLLGEQYAESGRVLQIHFWAGIFVALGVAIQQWYLAEDRLRLDFYRTVSGAVVNLGLNLVMIPRYGIIGAAIATVVSQFFAAYFSAWWFPAGRRAWSLLNRGIMRPFTLIISRRG